MARLAIAIDARRAREGARVAEKEIGRVVRTAKQGRDAMGRFVTAGGVGNRGFFARTQAIRGQSVAVGQLTGSVRRFAAVLLGFAGAREATNTLLDFERNVTDARKAADIGFGDLARFEDGLISLSRTPGISNTAAELADIAATAGTLGVRGVPDLLKFTEVTSKLSGSLRGVAAPEIAEGMGKILNILGEGAGRAEAFGNVYARMEDTVTGGAREILRASREVSVGISQFGPSSAEVLGLGASMADLGIKAELSRSTVGRSMRAISTSLAEGGEEARLFAELTGQSVDGLRESFGTDAVDTFVRFLAGLKSASDQGLNTTLVLEKLGLSGDELNSVLPTLAKNHERLAEVIGVARMEEEKQVKLNEDAALVAGTLGAKLGLLSRTLQAVILKFRSTKGPIGEFVQDLANSIGLVFGLSGAEKDATERSRALASGIQTVAVALGVMVATSAATFVFNLGKNAALAAIGIGRLLPVMLSALGIMTGLGVAAAGFEFARYVIGEFRSVREVMAVFESDWEHFVLGLVKKASDISLSLTDIKEAVGLDVSDDEKQVVRFARFAQGKMFAARENAIEEKLAARIAGIQEDFTDEQGNLTDRKTGESFGDFLKKDIVRAGEALLGLPGVIGKVKSGLSGLGDGASESADEWGALTNEMKIASDVSGHVDVDLAGLAGGFEGLREALGGARDGTREYLNDLRSGLDLIGKTTEEQQKLTESRELAAIASESGLSPSVAAARQAELLGIQKTRAGLEEQSKLVDELKARWEQLGDSIGLSFGSAVEKLVTGVSSARDVVLALLQDISKAVVQQTISQPISSGVSGLLQGLLNPTPSANGNIFKSGQVVPFANGGIISQPTYFGMQGGQVGLAGEAGPEIAIAPLARTPGGRMGVEAIIPPGLRGGGGGGGTMNVYQNIQTQDADSFRRSKRQIALDAKKGLGIG